jgi:dTDP-4-dehydrorhamnose reductase
MKLLITGAGGMLGQAVSKTARERGHDVVAASRLMLDVTAADAVGRFVDEHRPEAIVHCAAFTDVDGAENQSARAFTVNADATQTVARSAAAVDARFIYPSTDYVFDGTATHPYLPTHHVRPLNAYGRSKLAGEKAALDAPRHLIVRTSWLYGAGGRNFVTSILQRARAGESLRVVGDQRGSPTWTRDLSRTLLLLLEQEAPAGIYHACNRGHTTWYEFAREVLELSGLKPPITQITTDEIARPAHRPSYSVLDCSTTEALVGPLPHWREAMRNALAEGLE